MKTRDGFAKHLILVSLCSTLLVSSNAQDRVQTSYGEITIPTYPWRDNNDINPSFRSTSIPSYSPYPTTYPYSRQDNISKTKVDKTYKTLILENEYLKVTVVPDLGGHVHSIYDKIAGKQMLYENKYLKPSLISLRGAWASGGIEFNTGPQGHTVTCLSPVEAKFVTYEDGSKAIAIGDVEQVYHTQWVVTVRLRPGRSFLEEHIRITNPTDLSHIYYFWNCVAVPNTPSTQLIYPMTLGSDHDGTTFFKWPFNDEGKDISWLKNYPNPASIFSYRCNQDFYGSFDHALDYGVLSNSNHFELIGKKSWTWGTGKWGGLFEKSLTDDGSHYNEIQTGPFPTQSDYGILQPHQTAEWDEWWYPVRGTQGVAYSNKDITTNIFNDEKKKTLTVLVNGTGTWLNATCAVNGIGSLPISIASEKSSQVRFATKDMKGPFQITISSGETILAEFTYPLRVPERSIPEKPKELPSEDTPAGCWLRGILAGKQGGLAIAAQWFEKALDKDPYLTSAMTSLAQIKIDGAKYAEAKVLLEKSTKFNPDDAWALYYLALCNWKLGLTEDALEVAYNAGRHAESAGPGYGLAGAILVEQGKYLPAIDVLQKALRYDAQDLASINLIALSHWKLGNKAEAQRQLDVVQSVDPLDIPSGILRAMTGVEDKEFFSRISGRQEEVLDGMEFFLRAGLKKEAVFVLEHYYVQSEIKEPTPLVFYYHGVLANDKKSLQKAAEMNPDYVFPNLPSSFSMLEEVIKQQPGDWKAKYYLGNILFEHSRKNEAVKVWQEALLINDTYSVVHRNLGIVAWKVDHDLVRAITHYEKAIELNPVDYPLYQDLAALYIDEKVAQYSTAATLLENVRLKVPDNQFLNALLCRAYLAMGEHKKILDMVAENSFAQFEGITGIYHCYTMACLGLGEELFKKGDYAKALQKFQASFNYPESLGPGPMENPPAAESQYWVGLTLEKLGKKADAVSAFKSSVEEGKKGDERNKNFAQEASAKLKKL